MYFMGPQASSGATSMFSSISPGVNVVKLSNVIVVNAWSVTRYSINGTTVYATKIVFSNPLSSLVKVYYYSSDSSQYFQLDSSLSGTVTWSITSYDPPGPWSTAPTVNSSGMVTVDSNYGGNFVVTASNGTDTVTFQFSLPSN